MKNSYKIIEDYVEVYCNYNGEHIVYIDVEDLILFDRKTISLKKKSSGSLYAITNNDGKKAYIHRTIMNAVEGSIIDHINRNPLDNRKSNLRIVSNRENMWNTEVLTNTGERCITLTEQGYVARMMVGNTNVHVGQFADMSTAIYYRDLFLERLELLGDYTLAKESIQGEIEKVKFKSRKANNNTGHKLISFSKGRYTVTVRFKGMISKTVKRDTLEDAISIRNYLLTSVGKEIPD